MLYKTFCKIIADCFLFSYQYRPLLEATENDHLELVRLLLSYGADPTLATYGGQTPLALSCSDVMRDFLTAYIDDIRGLGSSSWTFQGSASFMGKQKIRIYYIL